MGVSSKDTSAQEQEAAPGAPAPAAVTAAPVLLKKNDTPFKIDQKAYDPLFRPFHRLNARTYDDQVDIGPTPGKIGPSGKGHDCGCRNKDDFKSSALTGAIVGSLLDSLDSAVNKALPGSKDLREFLEKQFNGKGTTLKQQLTDFISNLIEGGLFGGFLKFIPSWVPVNRRGFGPNFDTANGHNVGKDGKEAEVEVEGRLSRSYQTHHHRPYTQWSRYYHWAFHVVPSRGFEHLVRLGAMRSKEDNALLAAADNDPAIFIYEDGGKLTDPLAPNAHFECLLDIGTFSKPPGDTGQVLTHPGLFYEKTWPFWPQHGDWFWATGRYVYDCTHATPAKDVNPDKPNEKPKDIELNPTLINPVKAFATARYEGVLFDESDEPLPAIRFSFFACRKGGYYDFDGDHLQFGTTNYEFAVDLPAAPAGDVVYEIGAVDEFALNTLLIRPRLVQKIEFAPYESLDKTISWHTESPSIQVVRPTDGSLPRMVKVTVPMDTVPKGVDGYGFTISFAWLAPGVPTGLKKVTVKLDQITFNDERDDLRMSIAVNGRMVFVPTTQPSKRLVGPSDFLQGFPDSTGIVLLVPPELGVRISASGAHRRGFGEFMEEKVTIDPLRQAADPGERTKDRRLAVGGVFNVTKDQEDEIKELADKKLKDVIPPQLLGRFKKVEQAIDDDDFRALLKKSIDDLVGQRRLVVWEKDVDFQESDATKKNEIACAVAREMSVFPVDFVNKQNSPMGFVEFLEKSAGTLPGDQSRLDVKAMLARLSSTGSAITTVEFFARPASQAEDHGFIVFQVNPGEADYVLKITATIADPDPPK
ncbi:MAG TPA: hypothetical protein VGO46_15580 [Gemmatimonadaceae bacterium]|nr:hypothetical protein [Gemmatimonadaceae bacterium]